MKYARLREIREDRDLTQKKIANVLKTSQANYSYIESGAAYLKADDLRQLCLFYGVSADYILGLPDSLNYPRR